MKITLDIPDGIIAGFFNGVEVTAHGMQLVSYQLSTDDLKDGITKDISYNTRDLVIDLGNSVPLPDFFNCPYVNRIGQLTVSVLLNRFARKEHRA